MMIHQKLANATLQIQSGTSLGTGFHFMDQRFVLTNYHVVSQSINDGTTPVLGRTEDGRIYDFSIVDYSDDSHDDFALLECKNDIGSGREILLPKIINPIEKGTEILFSGYPHGIPHLLVNRGIVSGTLNEHSFYLDGIVNGGNSGGPIIDISDFSLIGIVTQRRFLGGNELHNMGEEVHHLLGQINQMKQGISVQFGPVNLGSFMSVVSRSIELCNIVIQQNSNTGIGIGFTIEAATNCFKKRQP